MARRPELSTAARALRESIFQRLQGRLQQHGSDGVPLHLGDTYVAPPPAAHLSADDDLSLLRYAAPAGEPALRAALADKVRRRNGLPWVTDQSIQITVGATAGLAAAAHALFDPGDEVIVPTPHWPLIRGILSNAGAVPIEVSLSQQLYADPSLDPAELLAPALSPRTRALYLTTPNNPDGKVLSQAQLERIASFALAHDLWLLADEAYEDLTYGSPHISIASLPQIAERTVTVYSLSKSYALAGYRLGYAVGPPEVIHAISKISNHTVYNVPLVLQRAALRVLESPSTPDWLMRTRQLYLTARDQAAAALKTAGVPFFLAEAGSYLLCDLRGHVDERGIWPLVERWIDAGVSVAPGEQFGQGFEAHARICFTAVPADRLAVGLERLKRVLSHDAAQ